TEIGHKLEDRNPKATITFNFAGSSTLAQQINNGAPADVFASANVDQMQTVADADHVAAQPTVFVQNKLQIAVPKGNPADIEGIEDFGNGDMKIAVCARQVPCGAATQEGFDSASVDAKTDALEKDVRAVLTKVELGEVDAGLVYVTDVASANGSVEGIDVPAADQALNDYPIAVLAGASDEAGATAFVDYVTSDAGAAILDNYGFVT